MKQTKKEIEMAQNIFNANWEFIMGAPEMRFLPKQKYNEIAFAGRSNVGKSSIINKLTNAKIARISNTPGRTRELNFFTPKIKDNEPPFIIVDMPGYGYAKVNEKIVKNWTELIFEYLKGRATLKRVFILIDARHGIKDNDQSVLDILDKVAVSYQIVMTKMDKVKNNEKNKIIENTKQKIQKRPAAFNEVIATSSKNGEGIHELKHAVCFAADMFHK